MKRENKDKTYNLWERLCRVSDGACLSDVGNDVLCVDVNEDRVAALNQGEITIHEPGLSNILTRNRMSGRLRFTTDAVEAVGIEYHSIGRLPAMGKA